MYVLGFGTLISDAALKSNSWVLLADRRCCQPQQNQPILSERNSVLWVPDDLKVESAVPTSVCERFRRKPANWKSAKNERSLAE